MRSLLCLLTLVFGTELAAAQVVVPANAKNGIEVTEAFNKAWIDAYVAGDVEALVAMYAPDAAALSIGGAILEGHDALRDFFSLVTDTKSRNIVVRDNVVRDYGDVVIQYTTWNLEALLYDGSLLEGRGRTALVIHETPEGWHIIGYHPAFDRPPLW